MISRCLVISRCLECTTYRRSKELGARQKHFQTQVIAVSSVNLFTEHWALPAFFFEEKRISRYNSF